MRYLHTMLRVADLERAKRFYTEGLGFALESERRYEDGRFTLAFLRAPGDAADGPRIELTHNWDTASYERGNAYGHVAYAVPSIAEVQARLRKAGYDLSWGPGKTPDGRTAMAFVDDPDGYEIELLERG
ncbi:MAG TPA: VOC family protein [Planctomycetota bacterium]|nr:VOC family protein [Planctomycetota bacterium]